MSIELFVNAKSLMGELADDLMDGALWLHPTVLAALELADETSFDKASRGPWTIRTYRGIPIFVSESLARAGTNNRFVYETYQLAEETTVTDIASILREDLGAVALTPGTILAEGPAQYRVVRVEDHPVDIAVKLHCEAVNL